MPNAGVRLVIITGLSGSGKSIALDMLEDLEFYCIDNLPAGLVEPFLDQAGSGQLQASPQAAIALDIRNLPGELIKVPDMIRRLRESGVQVDLIFLDAANEVVIKRYGESRRQHPLCRSGLSLATAIMNEREILSPLHDIADLVIDSSRTNVHQLRKIISDRVALHRAGHLSLNFTSFGFKHGLPHDADYVFDVRFLPNPYWEAELRDMVGLDEPVVRYLESHPEVKAFFDSLIGFLEPCLEAHKRNNRSFLTVAIGCTGGRHRSVYLCERLARHFAESFHKINIRHTELPSS